MENKINSTKKRVNQAASIAATAILVLSIYSLVQIQYIAVPTYAAGFGSLEVSASNANTGKDVKYTVTAVISTRDFVKTLTVTFETDFVTNGGSAADASLGGVEGMREDGSLSCSASSCIYTNPRPVRLNPDRIVTLIIDNVNNADTSGVYDVSVATKGKTGATIDSGTDSVTISSSISTIGSGALNIENTDGDVTISASNAADTADVMITAEDDVEINSGGTTIFLDAANDNLNEVTISDIALTIDELANMDFNADTDLEVTIGGTGGAELAIAETTLTVANIDTFSATTDDGSITLEANGPANGDITIDAEDDISINSAGSTTTINAGAGDAEVTVTTDSVAIAGTLGVTGDLTITNVDPILNLVDTSDASNDDDAQIIIDGSIFAIDIDTDDAEELTLSAAGLLTASGGADINGDITSNADNVLDIVENTDITGTLDVSGLLTAAGSIDMDGTSITDSDDGEVHIADATEIDGPLTLGSAGTTINFIKTGTFSTTTLDAATIESIADSAVTADSVIFFSFDDDVAFTICMVDNVQIGVGFDIQCALDDAGALLAIADGTDGHYVIIG